MNTVLATTPVNARLFFKRDPMYLRQLIESAGISQREAARRTGVPRSRFKQYLYSPDHPGYVEAPYVVQVALEQLVRAEATAQPTAP